jgi:hypothetical protein
MNWPVRNRGHCCCTLPNLLNTVLSAQARKSASLASALPFLCIQAERNGEVEDQPIDTDST